MTSHNKALSAALGRIDKLAQQKMYKRDGITIRHDVIPTGSLAVDVATQCGGFPTGRFSEVYGGESSGKTTLCLSAIARAQRFGGTCAYLDVEHSLDPSYAETLGVDIDKLIAYAPNTAEQTFAICEQLIACNAVDLIVIDSAAALLPYSEAAGMTNDGGAQAAIITAALKKLTPILAGSNTAVVFTNQIRANFSVIDGHSETTPCGHALKHFLSLRISLTAVLPDLSKPVPGVEVDCLIVKNKLGEAFVKAKLFLNRGFVRELELAELGITYGVLHKTDGKLMFGNIELGRSTAQARELFNLKPSLVYDIEGAIRNKAALTGNVLFSEVDNKKDDV